MNNMNSRLSMAGRKVAENISSVENIPEFLTNDKTLSNIQLEMIKKEFDDRFMYLSEELSSMLLQMNNDEILKQMGKDNASASHIQDRIAEVLKEALHTEQESHIRHLTEQLAIKASEFSNVVQQFDNLRTTLSKCDNHLQKEMQLRNEKEKKLAACKAKLKEMTNKNSASLFTQDKIMKEAKKHNEKVNTLTEKIAFLEHELALKESHLKKKKKESSKDESEIQHLKEELERVTTTNIQNSQLISKLSEEKSTLQQELDQTKELLLKSEQERLELRNMYISLSEKVESLVKSDLEKTTDIGDTNSINFLKLRMKDLKVKLSDQIKDHKLDQKVQRKKAKEVEKLVEQKTKQLNEANVLIMKCQNKLEKYKEKLEEETRARQKNEKDFRRIKNELEEDLEREKKSFSELQREFSKRVSERSEESERRIRDQYETKIFALQRDLHEKEQQFQKNNLENMIQNQLNSVRKSMQPDQTERMIEVYENKIKSYQQDYIAKIEHQQIIREMDHRQKMEINDIKKHLEAECKVQLRELDERKNKEFNFTLTNVKQAVKSLELKLEEEHSVNKRLVERTESERKIVLTLKDTIEDLEQKRRYLSQNLEESTNASNQLRSTLEEETRRRKALEDQYHNISKESSHLSQTIEDLKSLIDNRDKQIIGSKMDAKHLKESLDREAERSHTLLLEKESLSSTVFNLDESRKKLVECITSVSQSIKSEMTETRSLDLSSLVEISAYSKSLDVDECCKQLLNNFTEFKGLISKNRSQLEERVKNSDSAIYNQKKKFEKTIKSVGQVFSMRIQQLKKELSIVRTTSEGAANSLKLTFSKQIDFLLAKIEDTNLGNQQKVRLMKSEHQYELQELERSWNQRVHEEKEKMKGVILQYQEKIDTLQEQMRDLTNQKTRLEQDCQMFQRKFEDFKRVLSLTNEFLSIPIDVQNGLLSNQKGIVERFVSRLREIFETQKREYEQAKQQLSGEYSSLKEELTNFKKLSDKLQQRCLKTENDLAEAKGKLEKVSTDYTTELNLLLEQFSSLENRHKEEILSIRDKSASIIQEMSVKFPEMKGSYEKKLKSLEEQLMSDRNKVDSLKKDRQKMASELQLVRSDLNQALSEIAQKQQQMEHFSRKSQEQFQIGEIAIDELQKRLSERDREAERLAMEKELQRSTGQDKQEIQRLQNIMEREFLQTSTNKSRLDRSLVDTSTL